MKIRAGTFILAICVSGLAQAESAFLSCRSPMPVESTRLENSPSPLHLKIAERKIDYLQKNSKLTADIISCLKKLNSWSSPFAGDCKKFEFVLTQEILEKNFAFRMSQALSFKPMMNDISRSRDMFDFESQVDVSLASSPGFGIRDGQTALLPEEIRYVHEAFTGFWRSFATRYLQYFEKSLTEDIDKYKRRLLESRNARIRQALDATTPEEMLKQLSFIDEAGFRAMAESEYSQFRQNHYRAWMSHLETMRVIAFIGKPEPNVQEMTKAFQLFQSYGQKNLLDLERSREDIRQGRVIPTDDMSSDPMITEEVLLENPDLCAIAQTTFDRQMRRALLRTAFIDLPITLGLLATVMLAPPMISLPLMVAADIYWVSTSQIELRKTKDLFFATLTSRYQQASVNEVYEAEGQAILAQVFVPLTLTMFHPSALKNLSYLAKSR